MIYIVSGGESSSCGLGGDCIRHPTRECYRQQYQGEVRIREGKPVLIRLPEVDFNDDKAGKPVGIHKFIGRRPIMAFGNSDGDFEMLEWTSAAKGRASD